MSNEQLYLALGIPAVLNVGLTALILAYINSRIQEVTGTVNARIDAVQTDIKAVSATLNSRIDAVQSDIKGVHARIDAVERRMDELKDTLRGDLHRVEEILDARLKHLEESAH